jgi:hypothetical protein
MPQYVQIWQNGKLKADETIDEEKRSFEVPMFDGERYEVHVYDFETGQLLKKETLKPSGPMLTVKLGQKHREPDPLVDNKQIVQHIEQLIASRTGFDPSYQRRIDVLSRMKKDWSYNRQQLRGGRLEYLVYRLLRNLRDKKVIDDFVWNSKVDKYGIAYPAPGNKSDFLVSLDNIQIVLEVTTIPNTRAQWSEEGASVPHHIREFKSELRTTIGIFSAPKLHDQLVRNLHALSQDEGVPILCYPLDRLLTLFVGSTSTSLKSTIDKDVKELMG